MRTMGDKYENDTRYRKVVDIMETLIYENEFTPSEMREMAVLASIRYEMTKPMSFAVEKEAEPALQVLDKLRQADLAQIRYMRGVQGR